MTKEVFMAAAKRAAASTWTSELNTIMGVGYDTGLALSAKEFDAMVFKTSDVSGVEAALRKRIAKYNLAKATSLDVRMSNPPGTTPDPAILTAISARLPSLSKEDLQKMSDGHQLAMAAENIMGYLLEGYLARHLTPYGFIHCAGEILRSADFITTAGQVWQVKNSDNSENSSSSQVRNGTTIGHWCRRRSKPVSAKSGKQPFYWGELQAAFGIPAEAWQNEEKFQEFVRECITINSGLLHVTTPTITAPDKPAKKQLGLF